jgi:hypothetical protein
MHHIGLGGQIRRHSIFWEYLFLFYIFLGACEIGVKPILAAAIWGFLARKIALPPH